MSSRPTTMSTLHPAQCALRARGNGETVSDGEISLEKLRAWVEERDYAGYEPYDILNARLLRGTVFARRLPGWLLIQTNKHFPSNLLRRALQVPSSKNPKGLGLFLAGYCDLARCGEDTRARAEGLKRELKRLRSADEEFFCWGYDWDYVSLRGSTMRAFCPNAIATVFCGQALLEMAGTFGDNEAAEMASSVGEFLVRRLNRSVDTPAHLCFSYTPENHTRVINVSALVGAFLARLANQGQRQDYLPLARRSMQYLVDQQQPDGSWYYGAKRRQKWVDGFHTGYNLCALLEYQRASGDTSFSGPLRLGYEFYSRMMFTEDGIPKYYKHSLYPIDIHSCAQALIVFCEFSGLDEGAAERARTILQWTVQNLQSPKGFFYYQRHRWWVNRVPFMRWAQAWMFRALSRFRLTYLREGHHDGGESYLQVGVQP